MDELRKVYGTSQTLPNNRRKLHQYVGQAIVSPRQARHPHLTCYSPLRVRDSIKDLHPLPPLTVRRSRESEYVVDAIKSDAYFNSPYHKPRRMSIIKPYNAMYDRHSAGYFRSPMVKEVVTRTLSAEAYRRVPPEKRGLHRMSARRRSIPTPPAPEIHEKEKSFVLDNIRSERLRNKQNPLVPEYDAMVDRHSQRYFQRKLVQNVLRKTIAVPQRLYPTITFYAPTKNDIVV